MNKYNIILVIALPLFGQLELLNDVQITDNCHIHDLNNHDNGFSLTYRSIWESTQFSRGWNIDSSKIYFTELDSLANPIDQTIALENDSISRFYAPSLIGSNDNQIMLYLKNKKEAGNWTLSYRSQQVHDIDFPYGDELILFDSINYSYQGNSLRLLNDQFMAIRYSDSQILGQRFDSSNQLVGNEYEVYECCAASDQFGSFDLNK